MYIRHICKVTKRKVEIQKNLQKSTLAFNRGWNSENHQFWWVSSVSPCLSLFLVRIHCCYINFHCSYVYSYYNSSRTLCIKCWDSAYSTEFQHFMLRFRCFADTTKRGVMGWRTGWRQVGDRVTLWISLL